MNTIADNNSKSLIHSNIKYLHDLCQSRDLNVPALKSLFWTKCKLMELRTRVQLPSQQYKTSVRCSRCFLERTANSKYEVQPMQLSKFEQKLVAKVQKNAKKVLTKYQTKCLEKIKKKYPDGLGHQQNQMVIICKTCNQKSTIRMLKPKQDKSESKLKKGRSSNSKTKGKKIIKKKSSSNSFCGLKADAVLEAQQFTKNKNNVNRAGKISDKAHKPVSYPIQPLSNKFKSSKRKEFGDEMKSDQTANLLNKAQSPDQVNVTTSTQNRLKIQRLNTSSTKPDNRLFATSDFIPLKCNGARFKLTKKRIDKAVNVVNIGSKPKKRVKKTGNKTLSEKAKLELFLQSM